MTFLCVGSRKRDIQELIMQYFQNRYYQLLILCVYSEIYTYPAAPSARTPALTSKCWLHVARRARRAEPVIFWKRFWAYYTEDFIFYILSTFLIYNRLSTKIFIKLRPILDAVRQSRGMVIGQQLFLTCRGLGARRLVRAAEELFRSKSFKCCAWPLCDRRDIKYLAIIFKQKTASVQRFGFCWNY